MKSEPDAQTQDRAVALSVPLQLKDKALAEPLKVDADAPAEDVLTPTERRLPPALADFVQNTHEYVREYIALGDQKAAFLFTIAAAMLVYIYDEGALSVWLRAPSGWGIGELATFGASLGLSIGAGSAITAVWPRLRGTADGIVFWKAIARLPSAQGYVERLETFSDQGLVGAQAAHVYELAAVCARKYRWISLSIWSTATGMLLALAMVISGVV